jgi:neutral ceramidase
MAQLHAGVARCDITPPIGIAQGNWSAQFHERSEGIDLPLICTALAVADGTEAVIIAEWDLLYPPSGAWLAAARARISALTGVPGDHIRLSASHTHAGPSLDQPWFEAGAEMIGPYVASLTDRLAGACMAAHRAMRPAFVGSGKGSCAVNANRRRPHQPGRPMLGPDPAGFSDHEVGVIRIDAADGQPLAVLVNYAAHPTILAWDNRLISPDYPGTLRRTVESITGATCLFLQGAAGDQDTLRDYSCKVDDARWIGKQVGIEAARVAELIETRPTKLVIGHFVESSWTMGVAERVPDGEPDGTVRCITQRLDLPLWQRHPPTAEELAHLEALKQNLAALRQRGAPPDEIREANRLARRATLDLFVAQQRSQGSSLTIEVQAMRIGACALVGIPVEPFAAIGAQVKALSPFATTFFSGYTNGVEMYLPTADAYPAGYEVWMTPFAPEAAGLTVEESLALLSELR